MNWLQHMGYGSNNNKKYFMSRIKMRGDGEWVHKMTKIYRNPGLLGFSREETRHFLLLVCKNGWEYFIRSLLEMVTDLRSIVNV